MFALNLKANGRSVTGGNSQEGPTVEQAFQWSGFPADGGNSGNYKFVQFRLTDETCTLEYATGALTINPSVSSLPVHAVSPTFSQLFGYIITRGNDGGEAGLIKDVWAYGASAGDHVINSTGAMYAVWDPLGKAFPTGTFEIETGADGVVDVLIIGR